MLQLFSELFFFFFKFTFGCAGSSLLLSGLSLVMVSGGTLGCNVWACCGGGFSCCGAVSRHTSFNTFGSQA